MRLRPLLCLLILLVPVSVIAASGDVASDLATLRRFLEQSAKEHAAESSDNVRESGTELFPSVEDASGATLQRKTTTADGAFITAHVDDYPVVFTDVPSSEWFAPYVRDVIDQGIVSGYRDANGLAKGLFGPADSVTIEQLAKIAVQVAHVDPSSCGSVIKNRSATGSWAEPFVRCAESKGWAVYADGSVPARKLASRAEVVVTLMQSLGVSFDQRTGDVFKDVDSSVEFGAAIETAARADVVSGYSDVGGSPTGFFGPSDPVNRAEVAKMVTRVMQVYGTKNAE